MFCAPSPHLKSRLLLKLLCICLPRRLHRDPSGKVEVQIAQTRKAKSKLEEAGPLR
jgi:hypothetical protein